MDHQHKIKSVIILLEGCDIHQTIPQEIKLESLNQIIREGNSTIIVDDSQITKEYPLVSLLSFGKTYEDGFNFGGEIQEGISKQFNTSLASKAAQNDNDEEVIEVKYISHPKKFSEISDVKVFVVTDSKKSAELCELTEISYLYLNNLSSFEEISKQIQTNKSIELLVIHKKLHESDQVKDALTWIENFLSGNHFLFDILKIIFSPFGQSLSIQKMLNKHEDQLLHFNEELQSQIKKIVPQQTWQFYRGQVALKSLDSIFATMLLINYRKELNRADQIHQIQEYSSADSLSKFGGKVIHCSGVLRETLFELGKLPKFGA